MWKKILIPPLSKIALFHNNFDIKSKNILFFTLKDNRIQLITGDKRKDDEKKGNNIKQN